jgi:RecA-family ATPase
MTDEKKKMTAQGSSVGADDGQSISQITENSIPTSGQKSNDEIVNSQDSLEEMYRRMQRMTDPRYLHTLTMTELFQTTYKSRPPVVEGLLYAGAYILVGTPKIGKSFLVAQIAYHVSTGQDLWGYKVHQGTVLYLALEDDFQRIQSRMFMMYGVNDTPNLHFATAAGKIGNGLDEQLKNFVQEHPDTNLIIIDTMQKIREVGGEAYSYASDYEVIGKLKQFADRHGVCILIVHHTRKQPAGDSFEKISGTTGLSGCADGALIMQKEKRTDGKATLEISGRDQPDQRLYLSKDQERLVWLLDHAENELWKQPPDPMLEAVAKIVSDENREWEGSPTELSEVLQLNMAVNRLTKHLNVNASRLLEEHQVKYENKTKHAGRRIRLTYVVIEAPMVEVIK